MGLDRKIKNAHVKEREVHLITIPVSWIVSILLILVHYVWAKNLCSPETFQRAGAAIVCVSIIALSVVSYYESLVLSIATIGGKEPKFLAKLCWTSTLILALLGTIIWGYGDIFVSELLAQNSN